jgi:hypothetical protein
MDKNNKLLEALSSFESEEWINQYFDLAKKLLTDLDLSNEDPRLAMSLNKNGSMPINIGQRYVLKPFVEEYIGCIVTTTFNVELVGGTCNYYFSAKTTNDAKWMIVPFPEGQQLPEMIYKDILTCCNEILNRSKKSSFRKHHSSELYDFTMLPEVRTDVLKQLKSMMA